ncbi:MAG: hypothetical protein IIW34_09315 [Clostridia bacterium]|nr:hypothetical protein [Clostridia bacterium]
MNRKKIILAAAALAVIMLVFWLCLPFRAYLSYKGGAEQLSYNAEVDFSGVFSPGEIRIFTSDYAAVVLEPSLSGNAEIYALFSGVTRDYRIALDSELIPYEAVNEECEILLDEQREDMFAALSEAKAVFGITY